MTSAFEELQPQVPVTIVPLLRADVPAAFEHCSACSAHWSTLRYSAKCIFRVDSNVVGDCGVLGARRMRGETFRSFLMSSVVVVGNKATTITALRMRRARLSSASALSLSFAPTPTHTHTHTQAHTHTHTYHITSPNNQLSACPSHANRLRTVCAPPPWSQPLRAVARRPLSPPCASATDAFRI